MFETIGLAGVNEVYLSVNGGVLDDPRLATLLTSLVTRGVRVEALAGEATWGRLENVPKVFAVIDAVAAFNARSKARFAAVHLDIEPHQLAENRSDHAFVPELAAVLRVARERASGAGLSTSADLPRFALDEHGALFAHAVERPFVMLYQLRDPSSEWLARQSASVLRNTYADVDASIDGRLVIGLRVDDYPLDLSEKLVALDETFGGRALRYGGWAIHDETKYRASLEASAPGR